MPKYRSVEVFVVVIVVVTVVADGVTLRLVRKERSQEAISVGHTVVVNVVRSKAACEVANPNDFALCI